MMDIDHYSENYWYSLYRRLKETHHYATHRKIRRTMKSIRREAALERKIEAQRREIKSSSDIIEYAYVVLGDGDFKNGVTDCSGSIDEGEVHAGRCFETMRQWLLHHETTQNYIRSEFTSTERQHERRDQLDGWSDETPLGIALDGLGDSVE